jgi:mRNA interferase HigB
MRVISLKPLREFWERHPESEEWLHSWYAFVRKAEWQKPTDVTGVKGISYASSLE